MSQQETGNSNKKTYVNTLNELVRSGEFSETVKFAKGLRKKAEEVLRSQTSLLHMKEAQAKQAAEQKESEERAKREAEARAAKAKLEEAAVPSKVDEPIKADKVDAPKEVEPVVKVDAPETEQAAPAPEPTEVPTAKVEAAPAAEIKTEAAAAPATRTGIPSYVRGRISPEQRQAQMAMMQRPKKPAGQQGARPPYNNNAANGSRPPRPGMGGARPQGDTRTGGLGRPGAPRFTAPKVEIPDTSRRREKPKSREFDDKSPKTFTRRTLVRQVVDDTEEERMGGRRKLKSKKPTKVKPFEPIKIDKAVITTENLTVKLLSEKIGKTATEIISQLMQLGIMTTINQVVDFSTMQLVADALGVEIELKLDKTKEEQLTEVHSTPDNEEDLVARPPIVAVMGHVDHGKTSLLDAIRQTSVASGEAGGITQHIGAYSVDVNGKTITFIDTPGHEAFSAMRERGAKITDIAIIIVAADDGVKPQTKEAIAEVRKADVPIIVAINKIDKPGADIERVKKELADEGLICEEWGGDIMMVPISAKQKLNVEKLLEDILFMAEYYNFRANPSRNAHGAVVEARLDVGKGPVANLIVENGTLHVGDFVVSGLTYGRIRAMTDDKGRQVKEAAPSMPVSVQGFNGVPMAGDSVYVVESEKAAKQLIDERSVKQKTDKLNNAQTLSVVDMMNKIDQNKLKELTVIVKADGQGSVEALTAALEKLSNTAEVRVKVVYGGVGAITQSDIMMAEASKAFVVAFNLKPETAEIKTAAERAGIKIRHFNVIYDVTDTVGDMVTSMLAPKYIEKILGSADVRGVFKVSGIGNIAGSFVQTGSIVRGAKARVFRKNEVVFDGDIKSLKHFKDDASEVSAGAECGIGVEGCNDYQIGDRIECYRMEVVPVR